MTPIEKLAQGRKFIMRKQAFFATIMHNLSVIEKDGTMATDGKSLFWSPVWVASVSVFITSFVVLHELLHVVLKHPLRRGDKDPEVWNIACDYVVNAYIVFMGLRKKANGDSYTVEEFKSYARHIIACPTDWLVDEVYHMPADGLFDARFYGMSADAVYKILIKEGTKPEPEGGDGDGDGDGDGSGVGDDTPEDGVGGGSTYAPTPTAEDNVKENHPLPDWGNVEDATGDDGEALTAEELAEVEKTLDNQIATAVEVAKGRGQMPAGIAEAVDANNTASQDWQDVLSDFLSDQVPSDLTFDRTNRYYSTDQFIMPAVSKEGIGNIAIFADASGSVTQKEFSQFMSDISDITDELLPESVTLIQFDTKCAEPEIIERGDTPELIRRRAGGTCFKAPFEFCQNNDMMADFDAIIVFTDGGADDYVDEPDVPVIWASTGMFWGGPPPWGEVVGVNFDEGRGR